MLVCLKLWHPKKLDSLIDSIYQCLPSFSFGNCNLGASNVFRRINTIYIITHPLKKYKRGGVYAAKNVLFTCFFLGFPREKFYTPRSVRGGGWKMDGVDKGSSNHPPSLIHFAQVLEFLGFLGVFNP